MAAPGYLQDQGVITVEQAEELDDLTQNAPDYLRTKGRYKPYGVRHGKDRLPDEEEELYFQKVRRKGFVSGGPVQLGPGTNRNCTAGEDQMIVNGTRYCRKTCKPGWTRNPDTHRCFKQDAVRRRRFECREGYGRNQATGRCRKFAINFDGEEEDDDVVGDIDFDALFGDGEAVPVGADQLAELYGQDVPDIPMGEPAPIPANEAEQFWDEADAVDMDDLMGLI
jgi:hypothetical protein